MLGRQDHQKTGQPAGQFLAENSGLLADSHSISSPNAGQAVSPSGGVRENLRRPADIGRFALRPQWVAVRKAGLPRNYGPNCTGSLWFRFPAGKMPVLRVSFCRIPGRIHLPCPHPAREVFVLQAGRTAPVSCSDERRAGRPLPFRKGVGREIGRRAAYSNATVKIVSATTRPGGPANKAHVLAKPRHSCNSPKQALPSWISRRIACPCQEASASGHLGQGVESR